MLMLGRLVLCRRMFVYLPSRSRRRRLADHWQSLSRNIYVGTVWCDTSLAVTRNSRLHPVEERTVQPSGVVQYGGRCVREVFDLLWDCRQTLAGRVMSSITLYSFELVKFVRLHEG